MRDTYNSLASATAMQYIAENFESLQIQLEELKHGQMQMITKLDLIIHKIDEDILAIKNEDRDIEEKVELIDSKINSLLAQDFDYSSSYSTYENIIKQKLNTWEVLHQDTKTYLISAEYLYSVLQRFSKEFSPCILQYSKAVENELYFRYFKEFIDIESSRKELNVYLFEDLKNSLTRSLSNQIISGSSNKMLSLGNMLYIFEHLNHKDSVVLDSFTNYLENKKYSFSESILNELKSLKEDLRNNAAHLEVMNIDSAKEAQRIIPDVLNSLP